MSVDVEQRLRRTLHEQAATAYAPEVPGPVLRLRAEARTRRRRQSAAAALVAVLTGVAALATVWSRPAPPVPAQPRPAPSVPEDVVKDIRFRLALGDAELVATTRLPGSDELVLLFSDDQTSAAPSRLVLSTVTFDGDTARHRALLWVSPTDPVTALPVTDRLLLVRAPDWPDGTVEVTTARPTEEPTTRTARLEHGLAVVPIPAPDLVTGLRVLDPDSTEVYAGIPGGEFLPAGVPRWLPQIAAAAERGRLQSAQVRTDGRTACRVTANRDGLDVVGWNLFDESCHTVDGRLHLLIPEDEQNSSVAGISPEGTASVRLQWKDGTVTDVPVEPLPPYAFVDSSGHSPDQLVQAEALDSNGRAVGG